jgi:hypothetical protein
MCKNPFGSCGCSDVKVGVYCDACGKTKHERLDKIDFMEFLQANVPAERVMYLQTIVDAIHNYLFFGLGRNGTSAEEFAYACQYLFYIRAADPGTWANARIMQVAEQDAKIPGKHNLMRYELSSAQVRAMCFDTHYEFSGLGRLMPIARFVAMLKAKRATILKENTHQVNQYMLDLNKRRMASAKTADYVPSGLDPIAVLTQPKNPSEVARLLYLPMA